MLRFYTAGESHGQALLAFISGLPASLPVDLDFINHELHRRQLGYGRGGRQKIEKDRAEIFAGVRHGKTIGAPIALRIENRDWANWEKALPVEDSPDLAGHDKKLVAPRPGHADLAGSQKFNFHEPARSEWPGRGATSFLSWPARSGESSTGRAFSQLAQSRFSMRRAMGAPMVLPWRTPAKISARSFSIFWRPPRP